MKPALLTKRIANVPLEDIPELLKGTGFSAVNLCVRDGHPVSPGNVDRQLVHAARIFAEEGISFPIITTRADFIDPGAPGVEKTLAACAAASVQLVKIGYWIYEDNYHGLFDVARRAIEAFAKLGEKHNVRLVLHTHSGNFLTNTAAATLALVKGLDARFVGAYLDFGHIHLNGEPAEMALAMLKDYLAVAGMQDSVWRKEGDEWARSIVPVGQGMVNWCEVKKLLTDHGFGGPLAFHADHYPPVDEAFQDLAKRELDRWNAA